ncbi:MAG: hypothetical protein H6Q71_27 [Firmicutes bacterium]|nr:hypothetical protein [Bacillota bacterium]
MYAKKKLADEAVLKPEIIGKYRKVSTKNVRDLMAILQHKIVKWQVANVMVLIE